MTKPGYWLLLAGTALFWASMASTQEVFEHQVLFDLDENSTTGCDVAVKDVNVRTMVPGFGQIVSMRVELT